MPKSNVYKTGGGSTTVEFNMTPMIDVTFQLIIFFILAGQIASDELAKMELSSPWRSKALGEEETGVSNRVIVNIVSRAEAGIATPDPALAGEAKEWRVGATRIKAGNREELETLLNQRLQAWRSQGGEGGEFFVEIRADRRVRYGAVEPAMLAASAVGIPKMNITALLNLGG
jgi:biopolymer transport protein ExbD